MTDKPLKVTTRILKKIARSQLLAFHSLIPEIDKGLVYVVRTNHHIMPDFLSVQFHHFIRAALLEVLEEMLRTGIVRSACTHDIRLVTPLYGCRETLIDGYAGYGCPHVQLHRVSWREDGCNGVS